MALLSGLKRLYANELVRERRFALMAKEVMPAANHQLGSLDMDVWQILVMGEMKQG